MENDLPHTRRLSVRAFLLLCLSSFVLFFLIPTASASPLHHTTNITGEVQLKSLYKRGEVNPVSPKHQTHPDPDMPGLPDFNVLAKDKLSVWDDQRLSLTTERFMPGIYQARVGIANGYFGAAVAAAGPFFEKDVNQTNHPGPDSEVTEGWPLKNPRQTFATVSGFFDCQPTTEGYNYPELRELGCESVISGIPHPFAMNLVIGDQVLNSTVAPSTISKFRQSVIFRDGLTQWNYTWSPSKTKVSFDIEFTALTDRVKPNVASTQLRVTPRGGNYNASIIDVLDGRSAVRSFLGLKGLYDNSTSIYVSNHPNGLPDVEAWTISTANVSNGYTVESSRRMTITPENDSNMTIGQQWDVRLIDGETALFQKFVGVASTDKFSNPESRALIASVNAFTSGWEKTLSEHVESWNMLMQRNLMTDYRDPATGQLPANDSTIEALQIGAVADRYYIMQNLLSEDGTGLNDAGISVSGLTSDAYAGMIFWDQETWIYPGIAITNPGHARQIPKYRVKQFAMAKDNAQATYVQDQYHFDNKSALFPWTSGRFGNATATGPALNYEYHINTDIVMSMFQEEAITGNEAYFKVEYWPVAEGVAHSVTTLLIKDGNGWSIRNMTDPDEYANNIDNGAFTLASISQVLNRIIDLQAQYGLDINSTWVDMANNVNIPRAESGITKEFQTMMNNVTVKQADVILRIFPLSPTQDYTLRDQKMDQEYYIQKQTSDGPAMTFAIASVDENKIAEGGCATFTYDLQARVANYRAPWFQMSEQANDDVNANGGVPPAYPFLTGHGGSLQIAPFGYLGLDLGQNNLTIQPSLPPPYKYMGIQDFYFKGALFRASLNSTHTNLTHLPRQRMEILAENYSSSPVNVTVGHQNGRKSTTQRFFNLSVNQSVTIPNDMYWQNSTTPKNILQCQITASTTENSPGQWPGAATDGNTGTRWQPTTREASNLTVNTSLVPYQQITQINLDWGGRTPLKARVGLTNRTDITSLEDDDVWVIQIPVQPNQVYGQNLSKIEIVPYVGNRTEYILPPGPDIWSGDLTILEIEGCNGCGWPHPTVLDNGTVMLGEEDGMGATVGEFEIIGTKETNMLRGMNQENADERKGLEEEISDGHAV